MLLFPVRLLDPMFSRSAVLVPHRSTWLFTLVVAAFGALPCMAQVNVEVPLELIGNDPEDRQVTGLAAPLEPGDAVRLGSARTADPNTVVLSGNMDLSGVLTPVPVEYTTGMMITVITSSANLEGATLNLNGIGPRPIIRSGGVPIAPGALQPGKPARLVYTGTDFQLVSATSLPCPASFTVANKGYCIADQPLPAATFFDAINTCAAQGARLCTISEWSHACRSIPGFFATVTEAEWVDHAANNNTGAKLVGFGIDGSEAGPGSGCEYGGQVVPTTPYRFRCCSNR